MFRFSDKEKGSGDKAIQQEVVQRFSEDKYLANHNLQVGVVDGVVTLEGTVTTPLLIDLAHEIASGVPGVKEVQNRLDLGSGRAGEDLSEENLPSSVDPEDKAVENVVPTTGEESPLSEVELAGPAEGLGEARPYTEDDLERLLSKGLEVVDRDGKKVGKIKEVRPTDFLLGRLLARDLYVPYFACKYDGTRVILNVLASEIGDQGWASPHMY